MTCVDQTDKRAMRRWWPIPVLVGFILTAAVLMVTASTVAPQAVDFRRKPLSTQGWFAAYPDIATGDNGLVAIAWTESSDPLLDKMNGPLHLAWTSNSTSTWVVQTVSNQTVYDVAIATSGTMIHLVWSENKTNLKHTTCAPPGYTCAPPTLIATAASGKNALQLDVVVDHNGVPHVVWVEGDDTTKNVAYSRKESGGWITKEILTGYNDDSESPAIAYANNLIHLVWIEWQNTDHTDSMVNYCRRGIAADDWADCKTLGDWPAEDYRARNPSIVADGANVYAAWDFLSLDDKDLQTGNWFKRKYAVAYQHSTNNGVSWRAVRSYPQGGDAGTAASGTTIFQSSEGTEGVEWTHYLRPQISLAASGTVTVPVLTWHARVTIGGGGGEEGLAVTAEEIAHKVFWDYATKPGSKLDGNMYWSGQPITLSTAFCGGLDMSLDSATGRIAVVGDLNDILAGGSAGSYLHATYHEQTYETIPNSGGQRYWQVLYNNHQNSRVTCNYAYLPIITRNAYPSGEE